MRNTAFHTIVALAILGIIATACSSQFKIEGNIKNLGNQNVLMVWATADGVKEVRTVAADGKFQFKGATPDPALVAIYDSQSKLIAHFVMEDGDHVQLRGDLNDRHAIEVKGTDVNERWYDFIAEHRTQYDDFSHHALDAAIEKYVAENPSDLLSTLLLMVDYSQLNNQQKMTQMLSKISAEAKPEWLMRTYTRLTAKKPKAGAKVTSLLLLEDTGDFGSLSATTAKATLLYLWVNNSSHNSEASGVTKLAEEYTDKSQLQIADIYIDPDTASWRAYTKNDGSTWRHFWAPEGPLNSQLKPLCVSSTPLYVVTDSVGNVKYNGGDITEATSTLHKILK